MAPLHVAGFRATCLSFSPFDGRLFLVGQLDGGCRLHQLGQPTPLLSWPVINLQEKQLAQASMISDLRWAPQRPSLFFVLHSNGNLHMFDLNKDCAVPVYSCGLAQELECPAGNPPPKLAISPCNKIFAVSFDGTIFMRALSHSTSSQVQQLELDAMHAKLSLKSL